MMNVNIIDIIVLLLLFYAAWRGWNSGILMQLSGIGGIVLGVWVSYEFGDLVAGWLSLEGGYRFLLIVALIIAAVIIVMVVSRALTGLFSHAGVSFPISLLGGAFSAVKMSFLLALGVLFVEWLVTLKMFQGVTFNYLHQAICYEPLRTIADLIFPYISKAGQWTRDVL